MTRGFGQHCCHRALFAPLHIRDKSLMKVFPIDPTPYLLVYTFLVFLLPWAVFVFWIGKQWIYLIKTHPEFAVILSFKQFRELRKLREFDASLMYMYSKTIRWIKITGLCWVTGFAILAITLFLLDKNGLLINYTKGIYR